MVRSKRKKNWFSLRKKTEPELPYEPPIWLGDFSNGELYHQQTPKERRIRQLILERGDELARRHGMDRREFMATGMGVALSMWAINLANGCSGGSDGGFSMSDAGSGAGAGGAGGAGGVGAGGIGVGTAGAGAGGSAGSASVQPGGAGGNGGAAGSAGGGNAGGAGVPSDPDPIECDVALDYSDMFIFDIQTHRVDSAPGVYASFLGFLPQGMCGDGVPACYSREEYARLFFLDSDTTVTVLSGIPATDGNNPLTNPQIDETRDYVNMLAQGTERVITHAMVLPNYNHAQQIEGMAALAASGMPIGAWKCYTPWGPGNGVTGFWLDDPATGIPFIEQGRTLGVKLFCCHKGLPLPGFDNNYGDPKDLGVVAKMFPDCKFIAYHSAFQFGNGDETLPYTMGNKDGVNSLVTACLDNGIMPGGNIYGELGSTLREIQNSPEQATHVLGKLLKYLGPDNVVWGTDCMWYGSPQPLITSFMMFNMVASIRDAEGYPDLTMEIKAKILGLNAATAYGIDPVATRCGIAESELAGAKRELDAEYGRYRWAFQKPVMRTRRDFFRHLAYHKSIKSPG